MAIFSNHNRGLQGDPGNCYIPLESITYTITLFCYVTQVSNYATAIMHPYTSVSVFR